MEDVQDYLTFLTAHPNTHDAIRVLAQHYPVEAVNQALDDAKAGRNIKTMLIASE